MAARLSRFLVALGLLLGVVLPSPAAAAIARLPTSQEIAASPVPARGADPANARSYFGARYYRADLGRFTTIDPVYTWQENLADPQRWNRYAYVRNNPLRYTDPDGRCIYPGADCAQYLMGAVKGLLNVVPDTLNLVPRTANLVLSPFTDFRIPDVIGRLEPENEDQRRGAIAAPIAAAFAGGVRLVEGLMAGDTAVPLSREAQKSIASLQKNIAEHEQRLAAFKSNPTVRPGMENLPQALIERQQQIRIKHLETEIRTFKENIKKLMGGGQ